MPRQVFKHFWRRTFKGDGWGRWIFCIWPIYWWQSCWALARLGLYGIPLLAAPGHVGPSQRPSAKNSGQQAYAGFFAGRGRVLQWKSWAYKGVHSPSVPNCLLRHNLPAWARHAFTGGRQTVHGRRGSNTPQRLQLVGNHLFLFRCSLRGCQPAFCLERVPRQHAAAICGGRQLPSGSHVAGYVCSPPHRHILYSGAAV